MRPYCKVSPVHFLGVSACVVDATPALSCQIVSNVYSFTYLLASAEITELSYCM